ncbi:hypothetical protein ILUMI_24273 [Ignelater luminosus]|uniref:Low molecular weight phosphotyrosine protein phosphatase n=1 Tax=Ignelater luminosus TaxID=2038154 RepID=A0A8K0FYW4_IGNLU|nr:hypothetical protein ILUMI_24273 [Ignelater luminosus]
MSYPQSILFVCSANICRSPTAEAIFAHIIKERGIQYKWEVNSAAIGVWHIGKPTDWRAVEALRNHSIEYNGRSKQIKDEDFNKFDYILGVDEKNVVKLKEMAPKNCKAKILLLSDFDTEEDRIIRDPYFDTGLEGFEKCYQQCLRCCKAFLDKHS